jgi:multidrug efflux system membrane fusion protein
VEKTDEEGKKGWVEEVEYRSVKVGRLHDGLRVITDGLKAEERIIVSGLQRVRQGTAVRPTELDHMPIITGADVDH